MNAIMGVEGIAARMAQIRSLVEPEASTDFSSLLTADGLLASESSTGNTNTGNVLGSSLAADGVNAQDLITTARQYVGVPYVWGGETLAEGGLDCSGLVVRSLGDLGITQVPRTAHEQQSLGVAVDGLNQAQPGDLLFFDNGEHVAIYTGDNQMLEAPAPGGSVRQTQVWETPTSIRRILPAENSNTSAVQLAAAQRSMLTALMSGVNA